MHFRQILPLLVIAAGASGCGGNGIAGLTGNGSIPTQHEAAIVDCTGHRNVRPVTIVLSCADGNAIVGHATWTSWGAATASGKGVLAQNTCVPNCASSSFSSRDVLLYATLPSAAASSPSFTSLTVTPTGGDGIPVIYRLKESS
ncbi:MAG: hypothetical protein WCL38_00230 [Actinomycetota bacterium]